MTIELIQAKLNWSSHGSIKCLDWGKLHSYLMYNNCFSSFSPCTFNGTEGQFLFACFHGNIWTLAKALFSMWTWLCNFSICTLFLCMAACQIFSGMFLEFIWFDIFVKIISFCWLHDPKLNKALQKDIKLARGQDPWTAERRKKKDEDREICDTRAN